ncbi:Imidazole glycerol phosphate synthase subunit HisH [Planctomycetes bacterium Poly30]|uniref:Imidazole glycerol phosphate synthase subunit HisH n=1 Tax=Saltatorellus ferox TaxID=2528018 RepID=A0A518EPI5_9BACT|nr:Imidazole glycerol phosphate synthase subunit HisH [Planctomycetes bacterium Poly30]
MSADARIRVDMVKTGVANVASVAAALRRLGADVELTADAARVREGAAVVLPGVGSFGAGMRALRESGLDAVLAERIAENRPTLAVCLGLQLLCQSSEETPGIHGLGVLPIDVQRLRGAPRLPHFGWNAVGLESSAPEPAVGLLEEGDAYFAHTFCLTDADALEAEGWTVARTDEGSTFVSAVERGSVLACQFHPELSGPYGAALLGRWLASARTASAAAAAQGGPTW